jgi:hypothetical protein
MSNSHHAGACSTARCSLAKPVRRNAVQPLRGLWLVIVMSLVSCGEAETNIKPDADTDAPISAEQARLEDFFAATWEEDLARFPASATRSLPRASSCTLKQLYSRRGSTRPDTALRAYHPLGAVATVKLNFDWCRKPW